MNDTFFFLIFKVHKHTEGTNNLLPQDVNRIKSIWFAL